MSRRPWLPFFFALLLVFQSTAARSEQITIDSEEQFRLAEEALQSGDYLRAVFEFERFIRLFPDHENVPKARLLIGASYLKAGDFESARRVLDALSREHRGDLIGGKALLLMGESYFRQGVFSEAEYYFSQVAEIYPQTELRNSALYRLGWSRMHTRNWSAASDLFQTIPPASPLYAASRDLAQKSLLGETLPYKNPTTAGVLAGVLPGLGHAYVGRYKDGAVAFLLNGLFIWAAIEAFNNDNDVLGSILVFAELGWYTGNIYSAVNSAHKHNRKLKDDFLQGLPDSLNLGLLATRQGHLGLTLSFRF